MLCFGLGLIIDVDFCRRFVIKVGLRDEIGLEIGRIDDFSVDKRVSRGSGLFVGDNLFVDCTESGPRLDDIGTRFEVDLNGLTDLFNVLVKGLGFRVIEGLWASELGLTGVLIDDNGTDGINDGNELCFGLSIAKLLNAEKGQTVSTFEQFPMLPISQKQQGI